VIVVVLGGLTAINVLGVKNGIRTLTFFTLLKVVPLVVMIILGVQYFAPETALPASLPVIEDLGGTALLLMYAFVGFETVLITAGETTKPRTTIPKTLILTVIATGGDGDGYGIGGNHLMHTARRNIDITYLVMNNQIYGLTTGQISPTSRPDMKTKSTPFGNLEYPINPITSAIMNGATYVARGYSADPKHLTELIKAAIEHKEMLAAMKALDGLASLIHANAPAEGELARDTVGLFHENDRPSLDSLEMVLDDETPLARRPLGLSGEQGEKLISRMM
jgi:hypothetical protein